MVRIRANQCLIGFSIGRWRCAELFPMNRKTCRLSHARHPRLHDLELSTIAIKDMPAQMAESLSAACRVSHIDSRLQFTARPLAIEHGLVPARNYAEVERLTIDDWNMVKSLITDDIEPTHSIRRYVSFASAPAASRRAKYQAKSGASTSTAATTILSGFVISEWDMEKGTLHWACLSPWGRTGEVADMLSAICEHSVAQVNKDLIQENLTRHQTGQLLLPQLRCVWVMSPFDSGTGAAVRLATSRGFETLTEARAEPGFVRWEAGMSARGGCFPPERDCHVPAQCESHPPTRLLVCLTLNCADFVFGRDGSDTSVYQVVVRLLAGEGDLGGEHLVELI
jgi:hypothetical protein